MTDAKPGKKRASKPLYSAPALEKGFDVLELLAKSPDGLTSSEIAQRLGRSLSEIFRTLVVMERRGCLHKNGDTDKYSVTYRVLEFAFRATRAHDLGAIAYPMMYELALACRQSCHMAVISGTRGLIVLQQESPGRSGYSMRLGADMDLTVSCSGHVLLAFTDPDSFKKILGGINRLSDAEMKTFLARLTLVRERGYEIKPSSRAVGLNDVIYPIFGFDGRIKAALTVPFLARIDGTQRVDIDSARLMLAAAARKISNRLGWFEPNAPDQP